MSERMRVIDLITAAAEHLEKSGFENSRLEVERMLGSVLDCTRIELYMSFERPLSTAERDAFRGLVRRRLNHEPLQHILGKSGFKEITVKSDQRALVPRPETELLVENALEHLAGIAAPYIADIGTGSGVIALSIAHEILDANVVATDISEAALSLARENAGLIGVADRVRFVTGDMLDGLNRLGGFDAILSNPPYVESGIIETLSPEVRNYDPGIALDGGGDGLRYLTVLAENSHRYLKSGGLVLLECGDTQAERIYETFDMTGRYSSIEIIKDLSKKNRIVKSVLGRQGEI